MSAKSEEKSRQSPIFREILSRIAGEHGSKIADILIEKEATDEELANETEIRLNLVRKILYDLYDNRVISYRRVRDEDTGWYVYYWKLEPDRALELFSNNKRLLLDKLRERVEYERDTMFFSCNDSCPKLPFNEAAEYDFKCPRCGKKLRLFDNADIIAALERQIETLKQDFPGS